MFDVLTIRPAGAAPFESFNVADIGDVPINAFNLPKCIDIIAQYYRKVIQADCIPITMGGDHTLTYPLLRAVAEKHGPVGLVQVKYYAVMHVSNWLCGTC